jgi:hypothetical protein
MGLPPSLERDRLLGDQRLPGDLDLVRDRDLERHLRSSALILGSTGLRDRGRYVLAPGLMRGEVLNRRYGRGAPIGERGRGRSLR